MSDILIKLIELKKINNNLSSLQKKFNTSVDNVLNFDLIYKSIIDSIKMCRIEMKTICFKQKSKKFKCFWPKCLYKTKTKQSIERHNFIHKNVKPFKCNECDHRFKRSYLSKHKRCVHLKERNFKCNYDNCWK